MATDSLRELIDEELARIAGASRAGRPDTSSLLDLFRWLDSVTAGGGTPPEVLQGAMRTIVRDPAPARSSAAGGAGEESLAGSIARGALRVVTSGFGLVSLVSGIAGLFGGGEPPVPEPLVQYVLPPALRIEAAQQRGEGGLRLVDYSQEGTPRAWDGVLGRAFAGNVETTAGPTETSQRFFLDHSQEIARAVREAMLNMHALNDVVGEL